MKIALFTETESRDELGIVEGAPLIGTVSRLGEHRKGIAYFLRMCASVAASHPDAPLPQGRIGKIFIAFLLSLGFGVSLAFLLDYLDNTLKSADDVAVHLQLHYLKPLYPIEIFYKPMTILVWGGTGILTLAGFWAADAGHDD